MTKRKITVKPKTRQIDQNPGDVQAKLHRGTGSHGKTKYSRKVKHKKRFSESENLFLVCFKVIQRF
ncbi:hypothetical protein ACWN8V_01225 [Vagococcus elongatus]|uniref:Uncharacterized protein n=1 Tax=Vagococcus elongatus TaxID=180344 RepID=A0A430B5Y0_9ENTE|nr:hypothetical protein [Vagococcus elongatus]RSU15721.1 hypothetical protein CBF29_01210 [Vagococcus elongatus]